MRYPIKNLMNKRVARTPRNPQAPTFWEWDGGLGEHQNRIGNKRFPIQLLDKKSDKIVGNRYCPKQTICAI